MENQQEKDNMQRDERKKEKLSFEKGHIEFENEKIKIEEITLIKTTDTTLIETIDGSLNSEKNKVSYDFYIGKVKSRAEMPRADFHIILTNESEYPRRVILINSEFNNATELNGKCADMNIIMK